MQQITISPATFKRLQSHAEPLVDTTESVINRALDALERPEKKLVSPAPDNTPTATVERLIDPLQIPDLLHTKILEATVDGTGEQPCTWKTLLEKMVLSAAEHGRTFEEIYAMCPSSTVFKGHKQCQRCKYLHNIDITVKRRSPGKACQAIVTIAQNLGIALDIGFRWPNGQRGRLRIPGYASA